MDPLPALRARFVQQRQAAEAALAQADDAAFVAPLGPGENSLDVLVRHVGGSLRSRFTDFLTTDGEKPDRHRDAEFEPGPTRAEAEAAWAAGWAALDAALAALTPATLDRTVTVRGEPHTVYDALLRALTHVSGHVGQIVLLAKHHAGDRWRTLSVPRGGSDAYTAAVRARHGA